MTLREILESVTRDVLEQMRKVPAFETAEPCEWDINTGWCEVWAEAAADLTGGIPVWLDNTIHLESIINDLDAASDVSDCAHCVLWLDGRFYDSECLQGTPDVRTIATRVTRDEFIASRAT
jgi:hypothetical protein